MPAADVARRVGMSVGGLHRQEPGVGPAPRCGANSISVPKRRTPSRLFTTRPPRVRLNKIEPSRGDEWGAVTNRLLVMLVRDHLAAKDDDKKAEIEAKVRNCTRALFLIQQDRRKAELAEIEKRGERLRKVIAARKEKAGEMIDARVDRQLGRPDPLGWDDPTETGRPQAWAWGAPLIAPAAPPATPIPAAEGTTAPQSP